MRVWLYYRLSRDEDIELNSLNNQRKIIADYADEHEYEIVGESFDDNVSGMHFDRDGIEKMYQAADSHLMDAVLVKDLSRLGRHKALTPLCIEYLARKQIKVISVTENIDTSDENDDLIVGVKGIPNDFYAKDISRKVRTGFRQKQKEGLVMIPPMGYFKDKNTGEIIIIEEAAEIIQQIYGWYIEGYGLKSIAKMLNDKGAKTPAYFQQKLLNKRLGHKKPKISFKYLWEQSTVKRVLKNEFYAGTVVNHKYENSKITKTRRDVPAEENYRHENFVPAIISKEIWDQVQFLLADKVKRNVRAASGKTHKRYTGLLKCGDCGCCFVAKNRYWEDKPVRIEYTCNGYHRYGKEHCTSHRIDEATLDQLINEELSLIKSQAEKNWRSIEKDVKKWISQKSNVEKVVSDLENRMKNLDLEIENILMERINDKENRKIYDNMVFKRREEKQECAVKIADVKNIDETVQKRKTEFNQSIGLIDDVIANGGISNNHLRMLIDEIVIHEAENGLSISISINAKFAMHIDIYDKNGEAEEKYFEMVVGGRCSDNELIDMLGFVPVR